MPPLGCHRSVDEPSNEERSINRCHLNPPPKRSGHCARLCSRRMRGVADVSATELAHADRTLPAHIVRLLEGLAWPSGRGSAAPAAKAASGIRPRLELLSIIDNRSSLSAYRLSLATTSITRSVFVAWFIDWSMTPKRWHLFSPEVAFICPQVARICCQNPYGKDTVD